MYFYIWGYLIKVNEMQNKIDEIEEAVKKTKDCQQIIE